VANRAGFKPGPGRHREARALDEERRGLLARLLVNKWESGDLVNLPRPSRPGSCGWPRPGTLPAETKQAVEEISLQVQDRLQAYIDQQRSEGKNPDPVNWRSSGSNADELQKVLNPTQLEEFLLRYSQDAKRSAVGTRLASLFQRHVQRVSRSISRDDNLNEQIQLLSGTDPNTTEQRKRSRTSGRMRLRSSLGKPL